MSRQTPNREHTGAVRDSGDIAGNKAETAAGGQATATGGSSFSAGQGGAGGGAENDLASQVAAQLAEILRGNPGALRDILAQAGQSTSQVAGQAAGQVQERATSRLDKQKQSLVEGLGSVAEGVRELGENLRKSEQGGVVQLTAQYGESLAGQIERLSTYLSDRDVNELVGEVEDFARRNATYFVGGAFLLGLIGARFLKSSSPRQALIVRPRTGGIDAANIPAVPTAGAGPANVGEATAADQTARPATSMG